MAKAGRGSSRRLGNVGRWAAASAALVLGATLVPGLAGANHYQASLEGSDFEIDTDANLKVDVSGMVDWAGVDEDRQTDAPTGKDDDSFGEGAKEDTAVPAVVSGSIPPNKSDLLNFGVELEEGAGGKFLHVFWHRVQEPTGTTNMDFEFNQSETTSANGVTPVRTEGDLLVQYDLAQGGVNPKLFLSTWKATGDKSLCEAANSTPCWSKKLDLSASGDATGSINSSAIPSADSDGLGDVSPRTFGEATIDFEALVNGSGCTSFGSAYLKSRSSDSFTSALKDFIAPRSVNVSNCGTIVIKKQTDPDGATDSFGFTTTGGLSPTTFNLADNGTRTYSNVLAGTYTVTEGAAAGDLTSIVCNGGTTNVNLASRKVDITLAADQTVTCTFNNALKGSILVNKVDGNGALLGGAGFTITPGSVTMASSGAGVFCTDNLSFGNYTITETTVPSGYTGAGPQNFTVASTKTCAQKIADGDNPDRSFTNTPAAGRINIGKADDDGSPLNGAVFTLHADDGNDSFDGAPTDAVVGTCTTGVSNFGDANTPAAGACSFIDVQLGDYWVDETTVPAGYSKAAGLPTAVTVGLGGSPGTGQTINLPANGQSFVNPQTHKVIVIVCHEGTAKLAASDVTNGDGSLTTIGTAPAFASEAELCSLEGFTGKSHGDKGLTVAVGSDAHGS